MEERWAEVSGYPNYAVSNLGRVWNVKLDREVNPHLDSYGYAKVGLYRDRKHSSFYIHRLVAYHFIARVSDLNRVKHRDGDLLNNMVGNLYIPARTAKKVAQVSNVTKPKRRYLYVVELDELYSSVSEFCGFYPEAQASAVYKVLRGDRSSHLEMTFKYVYK